MGQRENPSHLSLKTPNAGHFSEQVVSKTRVFINMVETVSLSPGPRLAPPGILCGCEPCGREGGICENCEREWEVNQGPGRGSHGRHDL